MAGVGLEGKAGPLEWSVCYTNRDGKDDNDVPTSWIPRNVIGASLRGPLGASVELVLSSETVIDGTGPRLEDDFGVDSAPYTLLNLGLLWKATEDLRLGLHVYNLLDDDEALFEYVPEPAIRPRSITLSLEYSL
jgi:outer membrane receptor protein involved in Fe transport